mmetsp:Transcript_92813/g.266922  ORF Transcript_92813/g.266922 Transcript_92813/m.266922 type:complete len:207 (-) Transcript_92813:7-627(-)
MHDHLHGSKSRGTDDHALLEAESLRPGHKPFRLHPAELRPTTIEELADLVSGEHDLVARPPHWRVALFNNAGKVDAWNDGEALAHSVLALDNHGILVVDVAMRHPDSHGSLRVLPGQLRQVTELPDATVLELPLLGIDYPRFERSLGGTAGVAATRTAGNAPCRQERHVSACAHTWQSGNGEASPAINGARERPPRAHPRGRNCDG